MNIQHKRIRGEAGPRLLITGGVHGDEFEPMAAVRRLAEEVPRPLRGELVLAPVANEPAFVLGRRCAEDGLDLARTCPGDPQGSVTQRVAAALSELIRDVDAYIDLHTGGNVMDVWPLVGYKLVEHADVLETQRGMARAFNLPLVWGTDARLEGRTLSVARDARVPAIYAEYLGSGRCDPAGVDAYVDGCLNVMAELGMIDRTMPPPRVERTVEDTRESAGHMQIRNPAPMSGFFTPYVQLGDHIREGQPLGVVCDLLGDRWIEALSGETGQVIVLRTFPRVEEGDALAVVLE